MSLSIPNLLTGTLNFNFMPRLVRNWITPAHTRSSLVVKQSHGSEHKERKQNHNFTVHNKVMSKVRGGRRTSHVYISLSYSQSLFILFTRCFMLTVCMYFLQVKNDVITSSSSIHLFLSLHTSTDNFIYIFEWNACLAWNICW